MLFRDVIGHDNIKARLIQSAQENRISHAQLFHGPHGSGNFGLALAFARYLSCPNRTDTDSCGMCPTCKKFNSLQHPDLHFSFPHLSRKNNKTATSEDYLEEWRRMVTEFGYFDFGHWQQQLNSENKQLTIGVAEAEKIVHKFSLTSYEGGFKFLILWMPELMNIACANKLLKTIEEPPPNSLFLLVSHQPEQVISTILSRTQMTKVPALSDEAMASAVITHLGVAKPEMAEEIANVSDGNYFKAYTLAKRSSENPMSERFMDWMRKCYQLDVAQLVTFSDALHSDGRETIKEFLEYALHMVRQCIVMNYAGDQLSRFTRAERAFAQRFAPFINDKNVIELTGQIERAHYDVGRNTYAKLTLLDLSLQVNKLLHA